MIPGTTDSTPAFNLSCATFKITVISLLLLVLPGFCFGQITIGFQGGEPGDLWGYTSTGASALAQQEALQNPNKVTGTTSLVVGGNTGGGNCFASGTGNGPSTARTFTFDNLDISTSNGQTRTLTFNWGNRFPACNGTGWDSGENLVFQAYHDGVAQPAVTLAQGSGNAQFSILSNQYTWTIPPCVDAFYFVLSVTTNRADELLFLDDVTLTTPQLNPTVSQPSPITGAVTVCQGSTESYSVTDTPGITYTWSGLPAGASFTSSNGLSSITVDWGTAALGTYTLTVTPSGGCGNTGQPSELSITVGAASTQAAISGPSTFCSGQSITLTSNSTTSNSWSTGETTSSISVSTAGTYILTVNSTCGNTTDTLVVSIQGLPDAHITSSGGTVLCPGQNISLTGSGGDSYSWSTSETTSSIVVSTAGNYVLTASNGCGSDTDTISISASALPIALITPGGSTAICPGENVPLTGSGGDSYSWSTGETTSSIVVSTAGNYVLTASNVCGSDTDTMAVSVLALPTASVTPGGPASICPGQSITLTASGGDSYSWSTGETTPSITVISSGTFSVTASNACGTASSSPVVITLNPLPDAQISGDTIFCSGSNTVLTASGGDSYTWSTGETTQAITVTSPGVYTVAASNQCGTVTSDPVSVTELLLPNAGISGATVFCSGETTVLTATGGTDFQWSTGETTAAIVVNQPGTYSVLVSTQCGNDVASVIVSESIVEANFSPSVMTGNAPLEVDFSNLSSVGAVNFSWNFDNGNTSSLENPTQVFQNAGVYAVSLTVTNALGCSDSYMLEIVVENALSSILIPNIFTPNGDHANDLFLVEAINLKTYELQIINRWGDPILTLNDPQEGWDGTINGQDASDGTYFYKLSAVGLDEINYSKTGFFVLQR